MSWTTAIADLRTLLSDGSLDKLRANKPVFGDKNNSNTIFKTFEYRRITDFTSATAFPLGVYIDGVRQPASAVTSDDLDTGYFQLSTAPTDGQKVECTYFMQWFLDSELDSFLIRASNWLGLDDNYSGIASGLKTAALKYAAHEAYQKLSLRYAETVSEIYRLHDAPDEKKMEVVKAYQEAAELALKDAYKARDDYYSRKGKSLAPLYGTAKGAVREVAPKG